MPSKQFVLGVAVTVSAAALHKMYRALQEPSIEEMEARAAAPMAAKSGDDSIIINSYSPRRNPTSPSCPRGLSRPVGRSVGLSVRRSVGLSVCRSVGQSVCRSVGQSVCRSVGQSVCRSVGLSVRRSIGLSVPGLGYLENTVTHSGIRCLGLGTWERGMTGNRANYNYNYRYNCNMNQQTHMPTSLDQQASAAPAAS